MHGTLTLIMILHGYLIVKLLKVCVFYYSNLYLHLRQLKTRKKDIYSLMYLIVKYATCQQIALIFL